MKEGPNGFLVGAGHIEAFSREIAHAENEINLARGALAISSYKYPDLDSEAYLAKLDEFSDPLKEAARAAASPREVISAINRRLFDELGFRGNVENYGDPRNSYL